MHEVAHVDIRIDRDSGIPAYRQIYQQIRHQIAAGSIPAGALIPKIRDLAASLGVARNTAEAAYRQLSLEGYAHGKRGIGYVVEDLDFSVLSSQLPEQDPAPASVSLPARRKKPARGQPRMPLRLLLRQPRLPQNSHEPAEDVCRRSARRGDDAPVHEQPEMGAPRAHDGQQLPQAPRRLIASIHEYPGDKVRIVGADAGLHILLGDGEKRDQSELINLARVHDVRVYGTNRYWVGNARPMRNFVLVGFSQIREEDVPEGIRRLGEAWYG